MMEEWVVGEWEEWPSSAHMVCPVRHVATGAHGYAVISWREQRINCKPEHWGNLKTIRITNAKRTILERIERGAA